MSIWEMIILGLSLGVDATVVSITNGLVYKNLTNKKKVAMVASFGLFQGLMPLIGYYLLSLTSFNETLRNTIQSIAKWVAFALLLVLGVKMIIEGIKDIKEPEKAVNNDDISYKTILVQSIATSIDALAVGFTLYLSQQLNLEQGKASINIFLAVSIIAIVTAIMCVIGTLFGKQMEKIFKRSAPFIGGAILCIIGILLLIE